MELTHNPNPGKHLPDSDKDTKLTHFLQELKAAITAFEKGGRRNG